MTKEELQQLEIRCPSEEIKKQVQANWDAVAKPLDGLGAFEALTAKIGAALGTADFDLTKKAVIVKRCMRLSVSIQWHRLLELSKVTIVSF